MDYNNLSIGELLKISVENKTRYVISDGRIISAETLED